MLIYPGLKEVMRRGRAILGQNKKRRPSWLERFKVWLAVDGNKCGQWLRVSPEDNIEQARRDV